MNVIDVHTHRLLEWIELLRRAAAATSEEDQGRQESIWMTGAVS